MKVVMEEEEDNMKDLVQTEINDDRFESFDLKQYNPHKMRAQVIVQQEMVVYNRINVRDLAKNSMLLEMIRAKQIIKDKR